MQAILAGTREGAAALGILGSIGTIEPEKEADLLLVNGNPAEDITALRRVTAVFHGGRRADG
jgi:imidazolonepropionase-like amidohydrolase